MSGPGDFSEEVALDERATAWLCEREEGFTPARAREFAAWRERDPRHAAAVARVEQTLALLDEMPTVRGALEARLAHGSDAGRVVGTASSHRRRAIPFPAWAGALAAALALAALGWWTLPARGPAGERYQAAEQSAPRRVELAEGSVIDLKAGSEVRVALTGRERRVTLVAGEAHFTVAKDPGRPFVVAAGGVAVRAVGTAFSVNLAETEVAVLVTEGKVELGAGARAQLGAGERARVTRATPGAAPIVEQVTPDRLRQLLAWQDAMTQFSDVPLREIVERFNRRNARQLVLADAALGARRIGGVIALDQVEAFVRLLEAEGDIAAEMRGEREIVLRRAP